MANTTCPECGNTCGVLFRRSRIVNGKTIYAKGRPFPIRVCGCHKKTN